jgi:hypothetical protein
MFLSARLPLDFKPDCSAAAKTSVRLPSDSVCQNSGDSGSRTTPYNTGFKKMAGEVYLEIFLHLTQGFYGGQLVLSIRHLPKASTVTLIMGRDSLRDKIIWTL